MQGKGPASVSVRTKVGQKDSSTSQATGPIHEAFETTRRGMNNTIQMVSNPPHKSALNKYGSLKRQKEEPQTLVA